MMAVMKRRIVVLGADGSRLRGYTLDFAPGKRTFHVQVVAPSGDVVRVRPLALDDVHAIFFVRDFGFDRERRYTETDAPLRPKPPPIDGGDAIRVRCAWGEVIEGVSYEYDDGAAGFFLFPTDPERACNLERVFLTPGGVEEVELSPAA